MADLLEQTPFLRILQQVKKYFRPEPFFKWLEAEEIHTKGERT